MPEALMVSDYIAAAMGRNMQMMMIMIVMILTMIMILMIVKCKQSPRHHHEYHFHNFINTIIDPAQIISDIHLSHSCSDYFTSATWIS